jgi:hypothetical protein
MILVNVFIRTRLNCDMPKESFDEAERVLLNSAFREEDTWLSGITESDDGSYELFAHGPAQISDARKGLFSHGSDFERFLASIAEYIMPIDGDTRPIGFFVGQAGYGFITCRGEFIWHSTSDSDLVAVSTFDALREDYDADSDVGSTRIVPDKLPEFIATDYDQAVSAVHFLYERDTPVAFVLACTDVRLERDCSGNAVLFMDELFHVRLAVHAATSFKLGGLPVIDAILNTYSDIISDSFYVVGDGRVLLVYATYADLNESVVEAFEERVRLHMQYGGESCVYIMNVRSRRGGELNDLRDRVKEFIDGTSVSSEQWDDAQDIISFTHVR